MFFNVKCGREADGSGDGKQCQNLWHHSGNTAKEVCYQPLRPPTRIGSHVTLLARRNNAETDKYASKIRP